MLNSPDTSQRRPHALSIMEQASALRLEMQTLRQRSVRLCQDSRQLCGERVSPQTVLVRSLRPQPQMSEPPPLAEATSIWVREMTRASQLHFELDVQVSRNAEVIAAVRSMREQAPDLADWVLPNLCPRQPARPAPVLPQEPLVLEITVQVLDSYNWEPISPSRRTRNDKTGASERRSA